MNTCTQRLLAEDMNKNSEAACTALPSCCTPTRQTTTCGTHVRSATGSRMHLTTNIAKLPFMRRETMRRAAAATHWRKKKKRLRALNVRQISSSVQVTVTATSSHFRADRGGWLVSGCGRGTRSFAYPEGGLVLNACRLVGVVSHDEGVLLAVSATSNREPRARKPRARWTGNTSSHMQQ